MPRQMSLAMQAALLAPEVRPVMFFEGEFVGGFVRLWTGLGPVDWNGFTWTGAGHLISVSPVEETADVVATGVTVTLSGVPTQFVSAVILDAQQGLPGRIWIGCLDAAGAIIADPVHEYSGRLNVPEITDGSDNCAISISYESRLINLGRVREFRYTHESQQVLYPGDLGFEYVATLQDRDIKWGR